MKRANRVRLNCRKKIRYGVIDHFHVIVTEANKDAAKKEYERQGYTVTEHFYTIVAEALQRKNMNGGVTP